MFIEIAKGIALFIFWIIIGLFFLRFMFTLKNGIEKRQIGKAQSKELRSAQNTSINRNVELCRQQHGTWGLRR